MGFFVALARLKRLDVGVLLLIEDGLEAISSTLQLGGKLVRLQSMIFSIIAAS